MAQVYLSQYSKRAALADLALTASFAATASQINPIRLDPVQDPNPTGLLYTSSTYLFQSSSNTSLGYDMYVRQNGNLVKWKWVEGMLNTGLLYGGVLSYSASSLLITSGAGLIMDYNASTGSEIGPIANYVSWGPITQSIENIATFQNTFVYIDVSGSASQQNVFFTPEQYHDVIPIGRISHYDNVVTNGSNMNVQTVYDIDGQQNIFVRAFGPLKLTGIATSGQISTLRLNIGSGTAFNLGGYYPYDPEKPSTYNMETYNTASIIRIYRDGTGDYIFDNDGGNYYTDIDPGNYDDGTGTLAGVGNNEYTIQRVMVNPITGRAHVYYGQTVYANYDDAVGAIFSDLFVESDATAFSYPFSSYLVVKGNTTDLLNAENKIVQAGLFRNVGGGGGSSGGGIPGGQDTQIQFNNNGVFDGDPNFTYNYGSSIVILTGSMFVSGAIFASSGSNTIDFYGTSSWAQSASNALFAQTSSFITASNVWGPFGSSSVLSASFASSSVSASYASSSPNFANTDLVFTNNRKHSTEGYSYFIYSDLVGGNETSPFDGFGVSGSFYFFNSSSNTLGTAAGSTSTYTYIEITSQSIDLSFNADPAVPNIYAFTNQQAYFSSSLAVTKSVYFPGLTSLSQPNVVVIDTASGQLYYLDSSSLGGTATNVAISSSGTGLTATVASINFTGAGVTATAVGDDVTVTIPGGAGVAGGANTQIQFNSGSEFSGSGNFTFDYVNNIVTLTGSSITSGSIILTGSMLVNGSISSSLGPNTVGFYGTASWAQNSLTSSFITASNVWGPFGSSSVTSASFASSSVSTSYAETASLAYTASFVTASNVWGPFGSNSVLSASYASSSTSASYAETASYALASNPAPSDKHVQYNNNGAFGASSNFQFDYNNNIVQISGRLEQATGDAQGTGAHAEGAKTTAKGDYSHAEGDNTIANSDYSHTAGWGTDASGKYQSVIGQYNVVSTSQSAFIVGDGSSSPNRHNVLFTCRDIFEVSASNVFLQGLPTSPELNVLVYSTASGQVYYTASNAIGGGGSGTPTPPGGLNTQIQFNSASVFSGSGNFTFDYVNNVTQLTGSSITSGSTQTIGTASFTGSVLVTGSIDVNGFITASKILITSSGTNQLTVMGSGSGSNIVNVYGSQGNLFTVTDSLSGSLFTVGDISGYPIVDVISDSTVLMGNYQAPASYTTAKITTVVGLNTIYSISTSSYDGAFFDYTLISGTNARAGQIMSIWNNNTASFTETTTTDIGSTSEFIFSVALTAGSASLQVTGSTGAIIKTIIKSI